MDETRDPIQRLREELSRKPLFSERNGYKPLDREPLLALLGEIEAAYVPREEHDERIEELEAELEAEREEAAFWEGQHDAELNRRIKAEQRIGDIERTHIELPVDADGVPIRPGDTLVRGKDMPFKVLSIDYNDDGVRVFNDSSFGIIHCEYRHAKPDHVKDLLEELMGETVQWCHYSGPMSGTRTQNEIVADYAERIRKVVQDGD